MRARFVLAALAASFILVGCDGSGSDAVSGYWEGSSEFKADTVLASQNVRIKADYSMTFGFDLQMDDGLVVGDITARREGWLIFREAGFEADTIRFSQDLIIADHEVRGTFLEPDLEVDPVDPNAPYEPDMWTFDVAGSTAETFEFIRNQWTFTNSFGLDFPFLIESDETFIMRLKDRPNENEEMGETARDQGSRWRADLRSVDASERHRAEQ